MKVGRLRTHWLRFAPRDRRFRIAVCCASPPQDQNSNSREITGKLGTRRKWCGMSGLRGHGAEGGLTSRLQVSGFRDQGAGVGRQGAGTGVVQGPEGPCSLRTAKLRSMRDHSHEFSRAAGPAQTRLEPGAFKAGLSPRAPGRVGVHAADLRCAGFFIGAAIRHRRIWV